MATAKKNTGTRGTLAAPKKMMILVTVVSRDKAEFYADMIQNFEVNMQLMLSARGTASMSTLEMLGLADSEKTVIISIIRRDMAADALAALEDKFRTVKGGKGIAYTVPMTSTIGVAIYQFLSNTNNGGLI